MALYKTAKSPYWRADLTIGGKRVRRSTQTTDRSKALAFEKKLSEELYRIVKLGGQPRRMWDEAAARFIREKEGRPSLKTDLIYLRWLTQRLRGLLLEAIDADTLDTLIRAKKAEGVQARTVNAMSNLLRSVLRRAKYDWGWLPDRDLPKFRMLDEPKRRIRFLSDEEAKRLLAALPEHLRPVVVFSLETGLRLGNVTSLRWSQVDLERRVCWIHADEIKNRKADLLVPLSKVASQTVRKQTGKHEEFVFTYLGRPMRYINKRAWRKALVRAGITNFRWHDLRHTWASWHVQDGTPLPVLQELGGWEDVNMVRKYAHLGDQYLAGFVDSRSSKLSAELEHPVTKNGSGGEVRHTFATPPSTSSKTRR